MFSMVSVRAKILSKRNSMVSSDVARKLSQKLDIGDWWLVYMLSQNLDPIIYKDVLTQLLERVEMRDNDLGDEKS